MISAIRHPLRRFFFFGFAWTWSSCGAKRSSSPPPITGSGASVAGAGMTAGATCGMARVGVSAASADARTGVGEGPSASEATASSAEARTGTGEGSAGVPSVPLAGVALPSPAAASRAARRDPGAGALVSTVGICLVGSGRFSNRSPRRESGSFRGWRCRVQTSSGVLLVGRDGGTGRVSGALLHVDRLLQKHHGGDLIHNATRVLLRSPELRRAAWALTVLRRSSTSRTGTPLLV